MKKSIFIIIIAAFLMPDVFSQYFNTTQVGILMGTRPVNERNTISYNYDARTEFFPSITMTHGKIYNEHFAAGIGLGYENFNRNLFPVFLDIRYTLLKNKVSPFFAIKAGYSLSFSKKKHYDKLTLYYGPVNIENAYLKKGGGLMLHPELGFRIPINEKSELLFTVAYRYQKIKSTVTRIEWREKWEHKENLNRLSFGVGITFK